MPSNTAPAHERDAVWKEVRERLRSTLNGQVYKFAFGGARPVVLADDRIVLAVETELLRQWIRQRYLPLLRDALFEVRGTDLEVEITVEDRPADEVAPGDGAAPGGGRSSSPGPPPAPRPATADAPPPPARVVPRRPTGLQPRFTFEAFVQGPSNRFAAAAALTVAEQPARAYNPFFIYGGVGLGKTHLLHAIGHFVAANHPELAVTYVSVETFTNEFINALRDGGIRSFKDRYRSTDILLIDDIQSLQGREQTQEEFFHTFNALHDSGKQIVISSDRPPKAIATLEDRLRSRFEMGLITDVQPPDIETRIAILQKRVRADGYEIHDPEVLQFIAGRVATNVRALEGALTRVVAHASISGRRINVELAHEILEDLFPADEGVLSIEVIQSEVCRYYGVTLQELTGDKRTRRIVGPRQVAMYLSRELTDASLPAIGRAFGGRDHTTVMYAVQKVGDQMTGEGEVLTAVQTLTSRLTGKRPEA
ncbi:chromosomal replication initiator protein DnaA [Miltoncostaea marina]|uniref:chromosomal replication initiator protein DnaA n=1 Tax=Miltoncostaea marina TaxID=2843215 RepID=UPI001C3CF45E|nr:chromosomal replication initiator protein DnaA [Miltoncostaea marina]